MFRSSEGLLRKSGSSKLRLVQEVKKVLGNDQKIVCEKVQNINNPKYCSIGFCEMINFDW